MTSIGKTSLPVPVDKFWQFCVEVLTDDGLTQRLKSEMSRVCDTEWNIYGRRDLKKCNSERTLTRIMLLQVLHKATYGRSYCTSGTCTTDEMNEKATRAYGRQARRFIVTVCTT